MSQEKSKSRDLLFSIQSEGLACNLTAGCMESVAKRRHGILFARPPFARRHFVLCSVFDGTLAEQSALVRLQASLQTHFACLSRAACILLRIDYIQHFVLIPYRRQAADFIHGFALILRNLLNFKGTKESGIYMLLSLFCCVH